MKYVKKVDIIEKIDFQREALELKLKLNKGIITKEVMKISQDLDKSIISYYRLR